MNCRIAELQNCRIAELPNCRIAELKKIQNAEESCSSLSAFILRSAFSILQLLQSMTMKRVGIAFLSLILVFSMKSSAQTGAPRKKSRSNQHETQKDRKSVV